MQTTATTDALHVFIDETGTVDLNGRASGSNLYICCAVFVDANKITDLNNAIENLAKGAVLKSGDIGSDSAKRLDLLTKITKLDFRYVFLVTNKNLIDKESNLKWKRSRYKFIHRKLHERLNKVTGSLIITIDQYGTDEFQKECKAYFENIQKDLFDAEPKIEYGDDKNIKLLQLADFIAGTLLYCFDTERRSEYSLKFRELLLPKEGGYDFFPRGKFETSDIRPMPTTEFEEQLKRHLNNNAVAFLERNDETTEPKLAMQHYTLNALFLARRFEDETKHYIFSDEIIKELHDQSFTLTKRFFTVDIIGGLRKAGIIIAGSPNGYKLALTLNDIDEYLKHDSDIIMPMLSKLQMARSNVKTLIGHDILNTPIYSNLGILVDNLDTSKLLQYSTIEPDIEKIEILKDTGDNAEL